MALGELFAILSMVLFSAANIMINQGALAKARGIGTFQSILITLVISATLWTIQGVRNGFSPVDHASLGWFMLAGVLTVFIGRVFLYSSIQHVGAVKGSAIKRLNPFFAVLLGVLLLDEKIADGVAIGMTLIFLSFAVLAGQSLFANRHSATAAGEKRGAVRELARLGYFYGPVSALAYASGYVARKQGLLSLPDPLFGTMVGAATGGVFFIIGALFMERYRSDLRMTFREFNPWLFTAGFFSTFGQIAYFIALKYSSVSKIALITSMEVFVTIFLSVIVFRSRDAISKEVIIAAMLGMLGTLFVIWW